MIVAGKVAADAISHISPLIQPGVSLLEIDSKLKEFIESKSCTPAFLNYMKFPNSACISVNEEVVHCVPTNRILQIGDIVTVDTGANYQGLNSDTAFTFTVGEVKTEVQQFLNVTYTSLLEAIKKAVPGNYVGDLSQAVETTLKTYNYGIVKNFVGHGIGRHVHEGPQIPNFTHKEKGPMLVEDMVICIEPIATMDSSGEVESLGQWNTKTKNNSLACHFEHTIWISKDGPKVLTKRHEEINLP
jgi:methionyl aminopeptidase